MCYSRRMSVLSAWRAGTGGPADFSRRPAPLLGRVLVGAATVGTWPGLFACGSQDPAEVGRRTHGDHEPEVDAASGEPTATQVATIADAASSGATTTRSGTFDDSGHDAGTSYPSVHPSTDLRFSKIAAGEDHWCGISQPEQDLICVEDVAHLELIGPIRDFDMSHDLATFHHWCAITGEGDVVCNGVEMEFTGRAEHVAVGFFNACASDSTHVECFFPEANGGFDTPPSLGGRMSAEMSSLCFDARDFHASCFGPQGEEWLPREGHYLDVVAIPGGACAAVFAPSSADVPPPDAGAELDVALGRSGIACFQHGNVEVTSLTGTYSLLDADVNGDGCGFGGDEGNTMQVRCWGEHANTVPLGIERPKQIAVSASQVCILDQQGRVTCYQKQ